MASSGSFCTLTRLMSFDEEPGICLQAADAAVCPPTVPLPPSQPPVEEQQRCALQAWLQQLGTVAAVELPPTFASLVAAEQAYQRRACTASRGWLAPVMAMTSAHVQPVMGGSNSSGVPGPALPAAADDPKVREALKKVQQLDGVLQAAGQRAAMVAAQGWELEQRMRDAGAAVESAGAVENEAAATACGLEGAMQQERRRTQHAERLRAALEGSAAQKVPALLSTEGSTRTLTPEQEQLVDKLLDQMDAGKESDAAAAGAAQDANPFGTAAAELAAIDARLAELAAGSSGKEGPEQAAAAEPAVVSPAAQHGASLSVEDDVEALKARYIRTRAQVLGVARRMRDIDVELACLRAIDSMVAAC